MKDFGRKLQTNVPFTKSEASYQYNQIPTSVPPSNTKNTNPIQRLKMELQQQLESTMNEEKKRQEEKFQQQQQELHQQVKIEDKQVQELPFLLVSSQIKFIIEEYKKGKQIGAVPLDKRIHGKIIFDDHIKNNLSSDPSILSPVLCNHGVFGSGKTAQQALNMHWFTDRFKNGVAIEITFYCDASDLKIDPHTIRDQFQFESSLVRGIMLRLIEFCYGTNYSTKSTPIIEFINSK